MSDIPSTPGASSEGVGGACSNTDSSSSCESASTSPVSPIDSSDSTQTVLTRINTMAFGGGPSNGVYPAWFMNHVAIDFRADFDGVAGSQTWDEHIETFRNIAAANPKYNPRMAEVVWDIDESNGRADAFCLVENTGRLQRARTETMGVVTYQRRGGVWKLWRIKTIRGSNFF